MHLLLASYFYPPSVGGVEQQSHLLARSLVKRGHSLRVVSARLRGFAAAEELDGVKITRVSPGRGSRWQKMATYNAGLLSVVWKSRSWADVIQVQQALYPAAAVALLAPMLRRPIVVRNAGSGEFGGVSLMKRLPLGKFALATIGRTSTGVSLSTEMTCEMREAGFRRIVEIPNAVEMPSESTLDERSAARGELGLAEAPVVLYVGRLEAEKGVDVLVDAWGRVDKSGAKLFIVGDGIDRGALMRQASTLINNESVVFVGSTRNVETYFRAADVFVLPSRSEGISNALLEAMAHQLPVVATAVGGNREVVTSPTVGTLVPAEDPAALGEAIRGLLKDAYARERIGAAARAHVATRYSVNAMVERYEQLYSSLL